MKLRISCGSIGRVNARIPSGCCSGNSCRPVDEQEFIVIFVLAIQYHCEIVKKGEEISSSLSNAVRCCYMNQWFWDFDQEIHVGLDSFCCCNDYRASQSHLRLWLPFMDRSTKRSACRGPWISPFDTEVLMVWGRHIVLWNLSPTWRIIPLCKWLITMVS